SYKLAATFGYRLEVGGLRESLPMPLPRRGDRRGHPAGLGGQGGLGGLVGRINLEGARQPAQPFLFLAVAQAQQECAKDGEPPRRRAGEDGKPPCGQEVAPSAGRGKDAAGRSRPPRGGAGFTGRVAQRASNGRAPRSWCSSGSRRTLPGGLALFD